MMQQGVKHVVNLETKLISSLGMFYLTEIEGQD